MNLFRKDRPQPAAIPAQPQVSAALSDDESSLDSSLESANATAIGVIAPTAAAPVDPTVLRAVSVRRKKQWFKFGITAVVLLLCLAIAAIYGRSPTPSGDKSSVTNRYKTTTIPLQNIDESNTALSSAGTVSINGQLNVNNALVLTPSKQPTNAVAGQLYFDQTSNQLSYYDGTKFVTVLSGTQAVQNIGNATGSIAAGQGVSTANNTLSNTGVLSLQGQTGNLSLTAGGGIALNGLTVSNSGVLSVGGQRGNIGLGNGLSVVGGQLANTGILSATAGANITVTNDGNGNITISSAGGSGTGTVITSSNTVNRLTKFTGVNTIGDSLLSDNGVTVTVNGNLSVTGTVSLTSPLTVANGGTGATTAGGARTNLGAAASGANSDITSLSGLTTALSVIQGGTGVGTLPTNSVLLGNGTSPISSVSGTNGQCLVIVAGAPTFTSCPGSGSVTGSGTAGVIPIWSGSGASTALTDSILTQSGTTVTVAGTLSATNLSGNGSGVTNVNAAQLNGQAGSFYTNASNINAGTLSDTRLSTNVTLQGNTFNGVNQLVQLNASGFLPALNGSLLTNLNGSNISSGTVADARLSTNVTLQGNTFNGASQLVQLDASTQLPAVSGALLTNLNGSNISSGTVANARLVNSGALTVTAGTGLTGGGSVALGSSTTLNVSYGSAVGTAVQGNTSLTCASGSGPNLSGGGNTITLGSGGTCNNIAITSTPSFSTVTLGTAGPAGVLGQLVLHDGATANTATLQIGSGSLGGNVTFNLPSTLTGTQTVCTVESGNCAGSGTGLVGSGTSGNIAKFNGTNSLTSSGLSESGTTLTYGGNVVIQGTNSLALGTAGPSGKNGAVTFYNSLGIHTVTLQAPTSDPASNLTFNLPAADGSNGQCLSTNGGGVLSFTNCLSGSGGGGGVTQITGTTTGSVALSGAVTINNALTSSGTITIDNAKADGTTKGIATFNSTNFSDNGSGVINTVQNINTTAAVTFGSLTLGTALSVGNGGTGATTLTANGVLYGNGTGAIQATAAGTTGQCLLATTGSAPSFGTCTGAGGVSSINTQTGAITISGTTNQITVSNTGGAFTLSTPQDIATTSSPTFATLNTTTGVNTGAGAGTQRIDASGNLVNIAGITASGTIQGGGLTVNAGGTITFNNLTGSSSTCLTLDASNHVGTATCATGSGSTPTLQNVYDNSTTTPSILLSSTGKGIVIKDNATPVGGNLLAVTANGGGVYLGVSATGLTAAGTVTFTGSGFTTDGIVTSVSGVLGSGTINLGTSSYITGTLGVTHGGTGLSSLTTNDLLFSASSSSVGQIANGTTGQCLLATTGAAPSFGTCTGAGGVSSITGTTTGSVALTGGITLNNALTNSTGNQITIDNAKADSTTKGIASFDSANFTDNGSGNISIKNGGVSNANLVNSSITVSNGGGLSVTGSPVSLGSTVTLSVLYGSAANNAVQGNTSLTCASVTGTNLTGGGGSITLGAGGTCNSIGFTSTPSFTSATLTGANSLVLGTAATNTGSVQLFNGTVGATGSITLAAANPGASSFNITVPNANGIICLDSGNCLGGAGGGANTALSNLVSTSINQSLVANANNTLNIGSATVNWANGYFGTALFTPIVDTPSGTTTLNIGQTSGGNATGIALNLNTTLAAGKTLTITGDTTANRATDIPSPTKGMLFFDTTTNQLLQYNGTKWVSAARTATKIVAPSTAGGGTQAEQDAADYVAGGTNNDQTAINNALGALPATGGTVYLMEGTYTISAAISVPNNVTLAGAGAATIITVPNGQNGSYQFIKNTDNLTGTNVSVRDLLIDGNKTNQASGNMVGIFFSNVGSGAGAREGGKINGVTIKNLKGAFSLGMDIYQSNDTTITGNTVIGNGYGIDIESTSTNNTINNNVVDGNSNTGIFLSGSNSNSITGNTANSNGNYGIQLSSSSSYNTVTGNTTQAAPLAGIYINSSNHNTVTGNISQGSVSGIAGEGILLSSANYNTVTGNTSQGNIDTGVSLFGSSNNTVTGNTFQGNTNDGVYLSTSNNNNISGNNIHGTGSGDGIFLTTSDSNTITGNDITNTAGSGFAINISNATSDTNYLADNRFSGTGATSINDAGTGTVYANQSTGANGTKLVTRTANDTAAFQIQNANGFNVLGVDSSAGQAVLGTSSQVTGTVKFNSSANTGSVTLSLGNPGTNNFTLSIPTLTNNDTICTVILNNCVGSGATTVGALNGGTANANGATISAGTLYLQSASASFAGLVDTTTQTFAGDKTFSGNTTLNNTTLAAGKTITITGDTTANRAVDVPSPTKGMLFFDTTTNQLLQFNGTKWVSDRTNAIIVAANNSSQAEKDAADYVATGAGDQATINSALSDADPAGSGRKVGQVVLLGGTYTIASTGIAVPNNVTLAGVGAATIITVPNGQNGSYNMIANSDTATGTKVTIRDLVIDGNKANQASGNMDGINFTGMGSGTTREGGKIINVIVKNVFSTVASSGIDLNGSNNLVSGSTVMANSKQGINISNSTYTMITGNHIEGNGSNGLASVNSSNVTINGNTVQSNGSEGIIVNTGNNNTVTNNTTAGNTAVGADGIELIANNSTVSGNTSQGNYEGMAVNGSGNTVTGNSISSSTQKGIDIFGNRNTVSGNTIITSGNNGIAVNGSNNSINGNNVYDSGGATSNGGLELFNGTFNSYVDNHVTDSSCTTNCYAIDIFGGTSTYLSNNSFSGDGTHAATINDGSTSTIYVNQQDSNGHLINKSQGGGFTIGTGTVNGTLSIQGGVTASALPSPAAPTLATQGTAGSTSYTYAVSALDGTGETLASTGTTIATGNATLNGTNFIKVTFSPVSGATSYKVYRTASGGTPATTGLIGTVTSTGATSYTFNDTGLAASGTTPASNTTGGGTFAGTLQGGISVLSPVLDTASAISLNIGNTNATAINVGNTTNNILTTINGTVLIKPTTGHDSATAFRIQTAGGSTLFNADTTTSTITIGASAGSGSTLVNNGATVNSTLALTNFTSSSSIGTAAATVDVYTSISIAQTSPGLTLTIPSPTNNTVYGRMLYVSNIGNTSFTLLGTPLKPGATASLVWANTSVGGASWTYAGADGNSILNQSASQQVANFNIIGSSTSAIGAQIQGATSTAQPVLVLKNGASSSSDLLELQTSGGALITSFTSSGNIIFNQSSSITASTPTTANAAGSSITISASAANGSTTGNVGGDLTLSAGAAAGSGAFHGGNVSITAGNGSGSSTSNGGDLTLQAGSTVGISSGNGGSVTLAGGDSNATTGVGGNVTIRGGNQTSAGLGATGGNVTILAGTSNDVIGTVNLNNTTIYDANGDPTMTTTGSFILQGSTPPAAIASNGSNSASAFTATGGAGQGTTGTANTAGNGEVFSFTSGAGGSATAATGTSTAGSGGAISITSGAGGNVTSATGTAGSGGAISIQGGAAGTGGSTAGSRGAVSIQGSGGNTTIGSTSGTVATTLNSGSGSINLFTNGGASSTTGTVVKSATNNSTNAFQVQNATNTTLLSVDTSSGSNYVTYSGFEDGVLTPTGWAQAGTPATFQRNAGKPTVYNGVGDLQIGTNAANQGATTTTFTSTVPTGQVTVSFYVMLSSGTMASNLFQVVSIDGATHTQACTSGVTLNANGFQRVSCTLTTTGAMTSLSIQQSDATSRTMFIDDVAVVTGATASPYAQNGGIKLNATITNPTNFQSASNSTTALQVQNASGTALLTVDTLNSVITVNGGLTINTGSTFTNASSTLNSAKALNDFPANGLSIGDSASAGDNGQGGTAGTVDTHTTFTVNQTTGGGARTVTLPSPTNTAAGRIIYISNIGSATLTISTTTTVIPAGANATFLWNGTAWAASTVSTGVSLVGTFSLTSIANGASITGNTITFGPADGTNPGMVTTGTQSFAGNKTFTGTGTIATTSSSAFTVANASSANIYLGVDTSTGTIKIGDVTGGNYVQFTSTGLQAISGARHTKTITLPAEYVGATLDSAQDSSCSTANGGIMASGFAASTGLGAGFENYYDWTTTNTTTSQCYDVVVQVPIPADFDGWTGTQSVNAYADSTAAGTSIKLDIHDAGGTLDGTAYGQTLSTGLTASTWANKSFTFSNTYTNANSAGKYITLRFQLAALNNSNVRIGTITLNYLSRY